MILRKARAFGYVLPPQTRSGSSLEEGGNTYEALLFLGSSVVVGEFEPQTDSKPKHLNPEIS